MNERDMLSDLQQENNSNKNMSIDWLDIRRVSNDINYYNVTHVHFTHSDILHNISTKYKNSAYYVYADSVFLSDYRYTPYKVIDEIQNSANFIDVSLIDLYTYESMCLFIIEYLYAECPNLKVITFPKLNM